VTTYGGDALPPCPVAIGHSPGEPAEAELRPAPLEGAARDLGWAKKHSSLEPFGPDHWDFDAAEEQIRRVFTETYNTLHAMWAVPCITTLSYPRAVQTRMAPLDLEEPKDGGFPEQSNPDQAPAR
jgi:hypothetical protein